MKRLFSWILVLTMVFAMVPPLGIYAADPVTVYLDPAAGSDTAAGTEEAPVKTFAGAYALLQAAGGTIVMLGDVTYTATTTLPACDHPVTITSKTGAEGIQSNSHLIVGGETTFENISLTLTKESTGTTICGGGNKLTMGEGVTIVPFVNSKGSKFYFCLAGGFYNGSTAASTDLTIHSGQYRYVYAAGYTTGANGNAKLTMTGGTTANLATCRTGTVTGNVEMNFSGTATVSGTIFAGSAGAGNLNGNCTITLGQGASFKNLYSGSNGSGNITGTVTVICDGYDGTFSNFKGVGGPDCAGTIGSSRLVLKSGTLNGTPVSFGTVDMEIPENKTMTLACDLTADSLSGAGTLGFSGTGALTAKAVTGTINCAIAGEVLENHVYIDAPTGSDIRFPADSRVTEVNGQWVKQDLDGFEGLVIKTDAANTMVLHTGLWRSGDTVEDVEVTPYTTETVDGFTYYYYPNALGNYYARVSRSGYIGVYQNIYMSPEEAATKTVETITLGQKATGGYVPSNTYVSTSEVLSNPEAWKSDISMFPTEYTDYMNNPVFDEDRDAHKMTTGDELDAELTDMDQPGDNMYRFSMGTSLKGRDIPLVIFTRTDLSAATTMEQAAALLEQDTGKLTILYRAQMHGNEPAGGEGALAMLYKLQGGYADKLLDKINLIVVPRLNPDGSYLYQRRLDNTGDTDPNRDQLHLKSVEMQQFQHCYMTFDPEVVMDGHERMWNNAYGDMQIAAGFSSMNSMEFQKTALALDQAAFASLEKAGLNGYYYAGTLNSLESSVGGGYYPVAGSMYILMESRGIHESDEAMERRVVGHMASATGLLNYIHEHAAEIKALVAAERAAIAQKGATYEETDVFALETVNRKTTAADAEAWGNLTIKAQTINWATGEVTFLDRYPSVNDKVVRTRIAPTAYVIPAELKDIDQILLRMELHGIPYTFLPEGATLPLQRYGGTTTLATLSEETSVRFPSGCYVFTMNHAKALVLASILEPDNTNSLAEESTGNFAMIGYLGVSDTYRYIRDLNAQGTVDYTVTDASFVNVTVWLDGTNGLDTNDGLTEATAVKTLEQAYAVLASHMEGAAKGSQANIKIVGLYDLGKTVANLPAVNFHVTISGKTTADGFQYTGGGTQGTNQININGETTFQNMTLHSNCATNFNHINCNGHKVVFGEGLNCTTKGTNRYFILAGGAYSGTTCASTDLTVRSGKWRTIYAGGYTPAVTGLAKVDVSGCWVYQNIAPSYQGTTGSVEIKVANTVISDAVDTSAIYAGPVNKNSIQGDVTITLGENVTTLGVYASSRGSGNVKGTVTIIADGVDLSQVPVRAKYSAATGTTAAAVLKLNADVTQNVTWDPNLPVDLNGHNITGNITVDGTLQVKDTQTDDFTVADGVYGKITGQVSGAVVAAPGYVAVDGESFHRLEQKISGVSIRPSITGIYYSGTWNMDEVLQGRIQSFGVAVSLSGMPGADFMSEGSGALWTQFAPAALKNGKPMTSVMIANIFSASADNNAERGKMKVYAAPYVIFADGTTLISDTEVGYSLYDVMKKADEQAYEANKAALEAFYLTWQDVMKDWDFQNIGK